MKKVSRMFIDKLLRDVSKKSDLEQAKHAIANKIENLKSQHQQAIFTLDKKIDILAKNARAASYTKTTANVNRIIDRDKSKRSIFLFGAHDYGNIGDFAIGYAQEVFIRKHFSDYALFTLTRQELLSNWQLIEDSIEREDVITVYGGGNLGDLWINEENARRKIASTFIDNPLVFFSQSIKFLSDKEMKISADIYSSHKKLLVMTRDDSSYEIAKDYFKGTTIVRTEDMVMGYEFPAAERTSQAGVLFVERNDKEKGADTISVIKDIIKDSVPYSTADTVISDLHATSEYGSYAVYDKIDELGSYPLVVTNRLHGAIFALVAGRPVVVVDNSYGKISGALENISKVLKDRIVFAAEDASNINVDLIKKMCAMEKTDKVPSGIFKKEFETLADTVRDFIES